MCARALAWCWKCWRKVYTLCMYNCVCARERPASKRAKDDDDDDDDYYYLKSSFPDISLVFLCLSIFSSRLMVSSVLDPTVLTCCWLAVQLVVVLSSDRCGRIYPPKGRPVKSDFPFCPELAWSVAFWGWQTDYHLMCSEIPAYDVYCYQLVASGEITFLLELLL